MSQQGQLIRLTRTGRDGESLWAYRYRVGGRGAKRVQRGGFVSERDAAEALERELERLRRERRVSRSLTLAELFYDACQARGIVPVIPLRKTTAVKRGEHGAPTCAHGRWTFAGSDFKRNAAKWRCPSGECDPKSVWVKAERRYPLIPRETSRFRDLY